MWPWEAAAFGYLCYSIYCHGRTHEPPGGPATLLVAVSSTLPDVVDKPLYWQFGVFGSGYALGHSILVGVPVAVVGVLLARRVGSPRLGVAAGIGLLSHDVGDALEHVLGGSVWFGIEHVLWPIDTVPASAPVGFSTTFHRLLVAYLHDVVTLHATPYLVLVSVIGLVVAPLWVYDGCPGPGTLWSVLSAPFVGLHR